MARPLIHPRMLGGLRDFYPSTCTIREDAGNVIDSYGHAVADWRDVAGHVDVPCAVSPTGGREVKLAGQSYTIATHQIALAGYYPAVTERMHAIIAGVVYNILLVEHDSQRHTTRLAVELVR